MNLIDTAHAAFTRSRLRRQATAAALIIIGGACLAYGLAVMAMSEDTKVGMTTALACCLPPALILFVLAYVVIKEGKA